MKQDIATRNDIDTLVKEFYNKLFADDLLKEIFENTVATHLEKHLEKVADFWDGILLDANVYRGNVVEKHYDINKKFNLDKAAFNQWLQLWITTIDDLFVGERAEMAKKRAQSIADIMHYKLEYVKNLS